MNTNSSSCFIRVYPCSYVANPKNKKPSGPVPGLSRPISYADFTVVRALLRAGRAYETAVETFAPYDKIQDENPEGRAALRDLIAEMKEARRTSYIFANNRFEGNAPETIRAITE